MSVDLLQINVWLDVIFVAVEIIAAFGIAFHWGVQIVNGRAHKKYTMGKWPDHSKPGATPRWLHAVHALCIVLLAFSGMMIRFMPVQRELMRGLHYVAMVIVCIDLVWRLWYAFFSERRDYKEFAITKMDLINFPKTIGYYLFIRDSKPHLDKYNILQKGTYLVFLPLMLIQAFTGFALMTQTIPLINMSPRELLLGWWLAPLVGGIDIAGWWCRTAHYTFNWLFVIIVTIHIYMALTEDFPGFLEFFGGERWMGMPKDLREDWKRGYHHNHYEDLHGYEDHGHAEHDDAHHEQAAIEKPVVCSSNEDV